jgi:hypothetical protein
VRPLSLYLDTSVLGGYFDAEFMADTRALWRLRDAGCFRFYTSALVEREVARAPEPVGELMKSTFDHADVLPTHSRTPELADHYVAQAVVPISYLDDAMHVALCVLARLDFLVSWNFKHLANARREAGFNAATLLQGYPPVRIVTPTFLIHGYEEKSF